MADGKRHMQESLADWKLKGVYVTERDTCRGMVFRGLRVAARSSFTRLSRFPGIFSAPYYHLN